MSTGVNAAATMVMRSNDAQQSVPTNTENSISHQRLCYAAREVAEWKSELASARRGTAGQPLAGVSAPRCAFEMVIAFRVNLTGVSTVFVGREPALQNNNSQQSAESRAPVGGVADRGSRLSLPIGRRPKSSSHTQRYIDVEPFYQSLSKVD